MGDAVSVGVAVGDGVGVRVGVRSAVRVGVRVRVLVGVATWRVGVSVGTTVAGARVCEGVFDMVASNVGRASETEATLAEGACTAEVGSYRWYAQYTAIGNSPP